MSLYNQKVIYSLLFSCAAETLKVFGRDPKWLGATVGFFMVLHTWGQLMNAHIHLHIIFPACGVNEDGSVKFPKYEKNNFLFPVHALSKVFRGKYIAGLKAAYRDGEMSFPGGLEHLNDPKQFHKWLNQLTSHRWVIYSKPPFGNPETVIGYVSRYTHRAAISNARILAMDNGIIRFSFKNYKNNSAWEEAELPADEFIRRFLYHVVPSRFHRVRHYGFLSNGQKALRNELKDKLAGLNKAVSDETKPTGAFVIIGTLCPVCKTGVMTTIVVINGKDMMIKGSFSELNRFAAERSSDSKPINSS